MALFRLRTELWLLMMVGLLALSARIAEPPLLDWDEATYVEVAHEAAASGNYLNFTWNGQPYLKKPPLLFWMLAGSFGALGESEFTARLPSMMLGLGTLGLLYLSAAEVAGRLAGTLAGLLPLGFYFFIARGGRECSTDAPLIFFLTLSQFALLKARHNRRWLALAGIAAGFALLSKGPAGLIAPIVAGLAVATLPGFRAIGLGGLAVMAGASALTALPWYLYQAFASPLFLSIYVGRENLLRFAIHLEEDSQAARPTIVTFLSEARHLWPLVMPAAALAIARRRRAGAAAADERDAIGLWLVWLLVSLGAAVAVQTKLGWYILPALVPLAPLAGTILARAFQQPPPIRRWPALSAAAALLLIASAIPGRWRAISQTSQRERVRSIPSYRMALKARRVAARLGGGELFFAGSPLPTLVYYSGMHCNFVETSELQHIELRGTRGAPPRVRFHDLILVGRDGRAYSVANLDHEWTRLADDGPEPANLQSDSAGAAH